MAIYGFCRILFPIGPVWGALCAKIKEPKGATGSQRDKTEFINKISPDKYTMVTQPKGSKSSIHQLEKWKIHPDDLFGNVLPTKSLFYPKP